MITRSAFVRLCEARDRLRANCEPAVPIGEVARHSAMSPFHFIRQFQALFGETPHQLRIQARMDLAKQLLALTDLSVTDVCLEVGCTSLGSFSDLFTRRVGVSPSQYRHQVRAMMPRPGTMPPAMIPGCLTLMGAAFAISEKQAAGGS